MTAVERGIQRREMPVGDPSERPWPVQDPFLSVMFSVFLAVVAQLVLAVVIAQTAIRDVLGAAVAVLQETDGECILAVWVAGNEAVWLAHALEGVEASRPGPYALMARLLEESRLELEEVRISRLVDEVYYAELMLRSDGRRVSVDARPSDALNLALRLEKPVVVSEQVLAALAEWMAREPHRARVDKDRLAGDAAAIVAEAREQQARFVTALRRWDYVAGVHADAAGRNQPDAGPLRIRPPAG
jgi:bifunctional DNase/RNase